MKKLALLTKSLLKKNQIHNLFSSSIDTETFQIKHLEDSVELLKHLKLAGHVLDLGTGGGLPGLPLAIMLPEVRFTLMDSTSKKIDVVKEIVSDLSLSNVNTVCGRCEDLAHNPVYRGQFTYVTARALTALPSLIEYALPFLQIGGSLIAYKGKEYEAEIKNSDNALLELGGEIEKIITYHLRKDMGSHTFIIVKKIAETSDKYPRRTGLPTKRPL